MAKTGPVCHHPSTKAHSFQVNQPLVFIGQGQHPWRVHRWVLPHLHTVHLGRDKTDLTHVAGCLLAVCVNATLTTTATSAQTALYTTSTALRRGLVGYASAPAILRMYSRVRVLLCKSWASQFTHA